VRAPDETMTYGALDRAADRVARALVALGVRPGDRVGVWTEKSAKAVALFQGALRAGAAYVPADPTSPPARVATAFRDCDVRAVVASAARAARLAAAGLSALPFLSFDARRAETAGLSAVALCWDEVEALPAISPDGVTPASEDAVAYILYTSGSTGRPKGVAVSHRGARAIAAWAARELSLTPADRLSNHAPFHFDLSVIDLYAAFCAGASVSLVSEWTSYNARHLVSFLAGERITVWYSVPSALLLMMEHGGLLEATAPDLRAILFAGEVFPIRHLARLRHGFPRARLLNLYGPTETNVCTFHEVGELPAGAVSLPIGRACAGDRVWAVKPDGAVAGPGEEGELHVEGPTVMLGYWGQPPQGQRPYATGDVVRLREDGEYDFVGRRDQMVKVRGFRIELGEIEAALTAHPDLTEAAVVVDGDGITAQLIAYVVMVPGRRPSLIELKRSCSERLPRYMIVDEVRVLEALPRTSNGKIDRVTLVSGGLREER
jgi:amino acid adenylation domain-containing protein